MEKENNIETESTVKQEETLETKTVNEGEIINQEEVKEEKKKSNWWKYALIVVAIIIIVVIFLLLKGCGNGNKYKIKIHYGDEVIEVDKDFKLSDLEVEGGSVSFLVDPNGNVVNSDETLDKDEYSGHIIPDGKQKVKVTYKNGNKEFSVYYQKGAGLLFPKVASKVDYIFVGWMDEETKSFPTLLSPVEKDMTLLATFVKPVIEKDKCTKNCDTNENGICDLNCDIDEDGTPDTNIDKDGDGKCDTACGEINGFDSFTNEERYYCTSQSYKYVLENVEEKNISSSTIDGKEVKPTGNEEGNPYWDLSNYYNSGDTHVFKSSFVVVDATKQKYFITFTVNLKFDGDCEDNTNEDTEVVNVKVEAETTVKCDATISEYNTPLKDAEAKGLVFDDTSTVKVVTTKFEGASDNLGVKCHLDKDGLGWNFSTKGDIVTDFANSRRGKTITDTCVFEVTTDGKKYNVTYNFITKYESCVKYTCKEGYTLEGTKCKKTTVETKDAKVTGYSCASDYVLTVDKCTKYENPTCPSGYNESATDNSCHKSTSTPVNYECPGVGLGAMHYDNGKCYFDENNEEVPGVVPNPYCNEGTLQNNECVREEIADKECPSGTTQKDTPTGKTCEKVIDATAAYSCSEYGKDYTLDGNKCKKTTTETVDATIATN